MKTRFILDAFALIAFLKDENGADIVEKLLEEAELNLTELQMNIINILEVYYGVYREDGFEAAEKTMMTIRELPLKIINNLRENVFKEAGRLKACYRISLADAIAIAEANVRKVQVVTADHHEFDKLEKENAVKVYWIR